MASKKEEFLANITNKQKFIYRLANCLKTAGHECIHADSDADFVIVQTAMNKAILKTTYLIGDDTDLLVLLCYHYAVQSQFDIVFMPEPKSSRIKTPARSWSITKLKQKLGEDLCSHLLFHHALLGCDTTSRLFGIGKNASIKLFEKQQSLQMHAEVFMANNSSQQSVVEAGEQILLAVYGGASEASLNVLRYRKFCDKICGKHEVQANSLPPTSASARFHSMRVYHQVQAWKVTQLIITNCYILLVNRTMFIIHKDVFYVNLYACRLCMSSFRL